MQYFNKRFELPELLRMVTVWKLKNDRIVFTNGCFDILHPGHVEYLHQAKQLGNRLIVGLNSDKSVRRQGKADNRPINDENVRTSMLAALHSTDAIILFDEDTPYNLIMALQPDILVKGGDYDENETDSSSKRYIAGSKEVRSWGGKVFSLPFLEGFSTTALIEKIRKG